jgi:hypothetical protein
MRKITSSLTVLAGLVGFGLHATPAHAQLARTFVSAATGDDANDCNRPTPCRTFQTAHNKTLDQGEITVLDVGGYGAVTITKSISIVNDGVGEASILVSGGNTGITVNAPAAASVSLRGITVQGIGFGGGNGVQFNSGAALTMTNCVIRNLTQGGIQFLPNTDAKLAISYTLVADNGAAGILVAPVGSARVTAELDHVNARNNTVYGINMRGFDGTGAISATITDSIAAANQFGIVAITDAGKAETTIMVVRSVLSNNEQALLSGGRILIGQSVVTGNRYVYGVGPNGIVQSFGDNYIGGNPGGDAGPPLVARK